MRLSLLTVARLDAPKIRLNDRGDLDRQRKGKQKKEEILIRYQIKKSSENLLMHCIIMKSVDLLYVGNVLLM